MRQTLTAIPDNKLQFCHYFERNGQFCRDFLVFKNILTAMSSFILHWK